MMRVSSEQYTVAWFTLAECVSRGERERAFGVYRLLAHSLDDRALAIQLEGDLFCAFKMPTQAVERYQAAARLYKQAGRLLEAASVYEHVRMLDSQNLHCLEELIELYGSLQFDARVSDVAILLVASLVERNLYDIACSLVSVMERLHSFGARAWCFASIVFALYQRRTIPLHILSHFTQHATHAYMCHGDSVELELYIAKIKALDERLYAAVLTALKTDSHNYK